MKQIPFLGWDNCVQLSNPQVELVVTADVGPRIIHFGFVGDENVFATFPSQLGRIGDAEWQNYGGHRFWLAPEEMPRTYYPDNNPVTVADHGTFVRFISPVETTTRMQKTLDVALDPNAAKVTVTHTVQNLNPWTVELAPWALSVMAPGGTAVFPLPHAAATRATCCPPATSSPGLTPTWPTHAGAGASSSSCCARTPTLPRRKRSAATARRAG